MSIEIIEVSFPKWEKYNPRSDRTNFSWFRFDNNFFSDPAIFSLSTSEKISFIFIMCEASKKGGKAIVNVEYMAAILKIPDTEVRKHIDKFSELHLVEIVESLSRHHATTNTPSGRPTNETNETDITNETQHASVSENFKRISPDEVRNLFDEMLGGKGRIKKVPGHNFPSNLRTDFLNITGNAEFNDISKWREYFELVLGSDWLLNKFNTTFSWLLNPDNAFKVFSGQYDNRPDIKKAASEANAKADALFETIVRKGRYEFKRADYSELEMKALEGIGGLAVIFDCTDFTKKTVIANLRTEYKKALEAM